MRDSVIVTLVVALLLAVLGGCGCESDTLQVEVQSFLDEYTSQFLALRTASEEAQWASNTRIVEGDDTNLKNTEAAEAALAEYTGSVQVIETARGYLEQRDALTPLQVKQLEKILYLAANNPQTVPGLVKERISAEAKQVETLYGFDFKVDGESVTANEIDRMLIEENDLAKRLQVWEASKEVGPELRDGLVTLVRLRNSTVKELGYDDFFQYEVSDFGMSVDEMMQLNRQFVREVWPLYRELHTWTRYELAERYGAEVPELIPAHWLPNRWGQEWTPMVSSEGIDLDAVLADQSAEWVVQQAEDFYVSLGFGRLPDSFWEKSSLYPLPPDAAYKKNSHASAWHIDYGNDVRSLMSVEPNARWWNTTHHELGHIYYYLSYTRPEVPPLLRRGANRGFHEAVGTLLGMASMQTAFLQAKGLVGEDERADEINGLLKEALDSVVFIPWGAGVMTHFEHDLYSGAVTPKQYNARWWDYVRRFQGIAPPSERGEEYCDAATKTHINNDPAQYYDYAISQIMVQQLHHHIATDILGEDPHNTNYYGREEVGQFLRPILESGATRDWREVMQEALGEQVSAQAMLNYFEPLMQWLQQENAGRIHTLPASPEI